MATRKTVIHVALVVLTSTAPSHFVFLVKPRDPWLRGTFGSTLKDRFLASVNHFVIKLRLQGCRTTNYVKISLKHLSKICWNLIGSQLNRIHYIPDIMYSLPPPPSLPPLPGSVTLTYSYYSRFVKYYW